MPLFLTVLWPVGQTPETQEEEFSFGFCKKFLKKQILHLAQETHFQEYGTESDLLEKLKHIRGQPVLVVRNPNTIIASVAIKRLMDAIENGYWACGPVFNETNSANQMAKLPVPYLNLATYLEVADILSQHGKIEPIPARELDPACIMYMGSKVSEMLQNSGQNTKAQNKVGIDTGALVHVFVDYHKGLREDLVALVPPGVARILDVGCAKGGYGKRVKELFPHMEIIGIEPNPTLAKDALAYYDKVLNCTIQDAELAGRFDLINCGDVLEHTLDPWHLLNKLNQLLNPGGFLVLSVPNVGHWTVVKDLLEGNFQYVPAGLLCITHLRWFTEKSIKEALKQAGFVIDMLKKEQVPPTPVGQNFINKMKALGYEPDHLLTNELIIRAVKK